MSVRFWKNQLCAVFVWWFVLAASSRHGGEAFAQELTAPGDQRPTPGQSAGDVAPRGIEPPAPETSPPSPPTDDAGNSSSSPSDQRTPAPAADPRQTEEEFELLKLFADTLDQIDRNYVQKVSRRELMEAAIEGMLSKLDPYSNYIAPGEIDRFKTTVESEFGGIGIQIAIKNGELVITNPLHGAPAYRAGLLAGDRITEIDGQPTKEMSIDDAVRRLKGEPGVAVSLSVLRDGESMARTVSLKREIVRVKTVLGDSRKQDDSWNYIYDAREKIGYIRITAFARHTTQELRTALEELKAAGMKGLVLDLRFNPGGLLTSAIEVSDLFLSEGVIVSTEGRNSPKRSWTARQRGTFDGFPMAVLVNHYSASASEIVAAALQDHSRAIVVGERSWGKGSVQNIIELENGKSALKLTTAGYVRPSGKNIHRQEGAAESEQWGVAPNEGYTEVLSPETTRGYLEWRRQRDILQKGEPEELAPFEDLQLEKALSYVRGELIRTASDDSLAQGLPPLSEDVQPIQPPAPE